MTRLKRLLLLLNVLGLVAACGNSENEPVKGANDPSVQAAPGSGGVSKYSPRTARWIGDADYAGELLANPNKQLPEQCSWVMPNPRTHLIDHYIENTPPEHIPLTNWKYDFIAGELALDNMDLEEAKKMFLMALNQTQTESKDVGNNHRTLVNVKLAYIARKQGDLNQSEKMCKEALKDFKAGSEENSKVMDVLLQELALLSWKKNNFAEAEKYLRERVQLKEAQSGPIGIDLACAQNDLANALFYQKKFDEADQLYEHCLLVAERLTDDSNHSLQAAGNLADSRFVLHKYADALELYGRLAPNAVTAARIKICKDELATLSPKLQKASGLPPPIGDPEVLKLFLKAAKVNIDHKKSWDAKKLLKAAKKEAEAIGKPALLAEVEIVTADADFADGNYRQAESGYKEALAKAGTDASKVIAAVRLRLLLCQIANNDSAGSEKSLSELKNANDKQIWTDSIPIIQTMFEKRSLKADDKQNSSVLAAVCSRCVESSSDNSKEKALALANLARTYQLSRESSKAEQLFKQSLAIAEKAKNQDQEQTCRVETDLGLLYMYNQQYKQAEPLLLDAMAYAEKNPGKDNQKLRNAVQLVSGLYGNWQRPDQQELYYRKEQALRPAESSSFAARQKISDLSNLSGMSSKRCDYKQTAAYLEEALALQNQNREDASSITRELISIYQRSGQYAKLQNLNQKLAQQNLNPNDRSRMQAFYAAAQAASKCGDYAGALKLLQLVDAEMDLRGEKKDKSYGCYYDEPRYTSCLLLTANCVLDGERNYDKAIGLYDKVIASFEAGSNTPACPPGGRGSSGTGAPMRLDPPMLVNLLVCCDAIGNSKRADDYRKQLKERIDQSNTAQLQQGDKKQNPAYEKTIALIEKRKRNAEEELQLMELVPQSMHAKGFYTGQAEGAELIERAITVRETNKSNTDKEKIADDYDKLVQIYLDNRNFNAVEPISVLRLTWLKEHSAGQKEISKAEIDYADGLSESGYFAVADKIYKQELKNLPLFDTSTQFHFYNNLARVSQMLENYDEELQYLSSAAKLAPPGSESWRQTTVWLAALYDVIGKHEQASAIYKSAIDGTTDIYSVLEPLRNASGRASEKKQYALADYLFRREIDLLNKGSKTGVGVSNALMQLARMYRWARSFDKSKAVYEEAIAFCKTHPADQGQIATAEQELKQLAQEQSK